MASTLGERLKYLRSNYGKTITQDDVAKAIGVTRAAYSHFENGRNEPDNEKIVALANFYDVTTDYLLGRPEPDDGLRVAAHRTAGVELTPEQQQDIDDYIEFQKAKYRKDHESKD